MAPVRLSGKETDMILRNGNVFLNDRAFCPADLEFGDTITNIEVRTQTPGMVRQKGVREIDVAGKYVIPGLVDIHTHGAVGMDASDGTSEGLEKMSRFYASRGITSWCPTTMTLSEQELMKAMESVREFADRQGAMEELHADCLGVHLEGPFLSSAKKGAQAAEHLQKPDFEMLLRLNEASGGRVRMITVAPEEDKEFAFIRRASKLCTVSLGHSGADYETAAGAFEAGAGHVTHMYNGMNGIHHRKPGIIGAAFDAGVTVELICDGLHIHPSVIRMTEAMFRNRITLISDSMRSAGMADGEYSLGGQPVFVKNGKATLEDGTLAGSSITLMDALRNAVHFGIPLEQAIRYASSLPAETIGAGGYLGKISEGYRADLLVLDQELNLEIVIAEGNVYHCSGRHQTFTYDASEHEQGFAKLL